MSKSKPIIELLEALYEDLPAHEILTDIQQAKISTAITNARIAQNLNQSQFADFMGVTQSQISKWESGGFNFTIAKLCEIADKLNMDFNITLQTKHPRKFEKRGNVVYLHSSPRTSTWTSGCGYSAEEELKEM